MPAQGVDFHAQLREQLMEAGGQWRLVLLQVDGTGGKALAMAGKPPADAGKRPLQTFAPCIGTEPVLARHPAGDIARGVGHQRGILLEHAVDPCGERVQRAVAILRPMLRQYMVVEHVQRDAGKTPPRRLEVCLRGLHCRVLVGPAVDMPVHEDFAPYLGRKTRKIPALDEIAKKGAKQCRIARAGQQQMGEVVHALRDREQGWAS